MLATILVNALLMLAVLLAGCTSYVPFKDGPAPTPKPALATPSAWDRKAEACRKRGASMEYIDGAWHCIAR